MSEPVTVIVRRRVRAGREAAFEAWIRGITQAFLQFPGHLGAGIIRPIKPSREYALIFRFEQYEQSRAWEDSAVRAEWLEKVRGLVEGEPDIQRVSGLEFWFTPPAGSALVPPRWKMMLVTVAVLWPLNFLIVTVFGPFINGWPALFRSLAIVLLISPLMTYIVMPWATRLFAKWLYPVS